VSSIVHVASPYHFRVTNNEHDLLIPAQEGTLNVLRSAAKEASVKRVVITSSFAAMNQLGTDPYLQPPKVHDESIWNPVTWEEAVVGLPRVGYQASKKFAELSAWDFVKTEKPHFSITTLRPPMIYGPPIHDPPSLDRLNESNSQLWKIISSGRDTEVPDAHTPLFVDVRDIAMAHVLAIESPKAENQRFTVIGGQYSNQEVCCAIDESNVGRGLYPREIPR
jgi:nucleoside-diphosphate-sugar epimerase